MSTGMQLEVGKTYVTRDGSREVKITGWYPIDRSVVWAEAEDGSHYLPDGRRSATKECPGDLVREAGSVTVPTTDSVPNADLIRAVLDGKVVQYKRDDEWVDLPSRKGAIFCLAQGVYSARLKPEPVARWHPVWPGGHTGEGYTCKAALTQDAQDHEFEPGWKVLRIELDPDTLDVVSARTEEP